MKKDQFIKKKRTYASYLQVLSLLFLSISDGGLSVSNQLQSRKSRTKFKNQDIRDKTLMHTIIK